MCCIGFQRKAIHTKMVVTFACFKLHFNVYYLIWPSSYNWKLMTVMYILGFRLLSSEQLLPYGFEILTNRPWNAPTITVLLRNILLQLHPAKWGGFNGHIWRAYCGTDRNWQRCNLEKWARSRWLLKIFIKNRENYADSKNLGLRFLFLIFE